MTHGDLEVELPREAPSVRVARLVVAGFAAALTELDDARLAGLRLAVAEACQTAIEERGDGPGTAPLRLRIRMADDKLHVWVDDPAGGLDSDRLLVAEMFVSELDVAPSPDGGTVAHLVVDAVRASLADPEGGDL